MKRKKISTGFSLCLFILLVVVLHPYLFRAMGRLLVLESDFEKCDAAVVLNSGADIYRSFYGNKLAVYSAPAKKDPFEPDAWWKNPRQIRWVMQEYGGWFFLFLDRTLKMTR